MEVAGRELDGSDFTGCVEKWDGDADADAGTGERERGDLETRGRSDAFLQFV